MPSLASIVPQGKPVEGHRPWPRLVVSAEAWRHATGEIAAGGATLLGLWGDTADAPSVHMAIGDDESGDVIVISL